MKQKTMRGHRNKLKQIISWVKENYPAYAAAGGIVTVTEADLNDPSQHFHNNTEDLVYNGINVDIVLAFLAAQKVLTSKRQNGKFRTHGDMQKFGNAIQFGAREANQVLPESYYTKVVYDFFPAYKKETVQKKIAGEMDSKDSDPITFPLYRLICQWALRTGNVFLWVFTVLQWNCMGRSISIDPLGFHNLTIGSDSIKVIYDNSKADQSGEKVSPKNIYANPFTPQICNFTALGIWLSLNVASLGKSESLFLGVGKGGTAASRYCAQLVTLLREHRDIVCRYARPDRTGTHGTRKGAALFATGGTTNPAPLPSVANRGEWSQGSVFDVYFLFAEPGDQYLGRCLVGLDPNSPNFAVLPPHFSSEMDRKLLDEVMTVCFGNLPTKYDVMGLCCMLVASMVHNIEFIRGYAAATAKHPFNSLALIQRPDLVEQVQPYIVGGMTMRPGVLEPTGIPPHISQSILLEKLLNTTQETLNQLLSMVTTIEGAVHTAIESNDRRSGQITMDLLMEKLSGVRDELVEAVKQTMQGCAQKNDDSDKKPSVTPAKKLANKDGWPVYTYDIPGTMQGVWHVPKGWSFPIKVNRTLGWNLWLFGQPANEYLDANGKRIAAPVRCFRLLDPKMLPTTALKNVLKTQWKPIFSLMEEVLDEGELCITNGASTASVLQQTFEKATLHVQLRASYIWKLPHCKPESWLISNWSKRVLRCSIETNGTDEDKMRLPPVCRGNKSHPEYARCPKPKRKHQETDGDNVGDFELGSDESKPKQKKVKGSDSEKPGSHCKDVTGTTPDKLPELKCNKDMAKSGTKDNDEMPTGPVIVTGPDTTQPKHRDKVINRGPVVVPGPDTTRPKLRDEVINISDFHALSQEGTMLTGCCVRGYLSCLVRPYHAEQGVKFTDDSFYSSRSWADYTAFRGTNKLDLENAPVIFIPIFTGPQHGGHFSLLVVDRTMHRHGVFLYFDSFPAGAGAIARGLKDYLCTTSMWKEGLSQFFHVEKMPAQFQKSNDCGVYTCCTAAAYLSYLHRCNAFTGEALPTTNARTLYAKVECETAPDIFGRMGRKHIEKTLRYGVVNPNDDALYFLSVLPLSDPAALPKHFKTK
jgi:hypothetical protein